MGLEGSSDSIHLVESKLEALDGNTKLLKKTLRRGSTNNTCNTMFADVSVAHLGYNGLVELRNKRMWPWNEWWNLLRGTWSLGTELDSGTRREGSTGSNTMVYDLCYCQ